ncbi:MAG: hypothetical protein GY864_10225, partial [Desulfobacterales bacterium]|nr:hypothetical protein [Desulfobacterales bacterium]
ESLHHTVRANKAYENIKGQKTLNTRYLTEDIPTGLYPLVSLGKLLGVPVERMEIVVKLSEYLIKKDLTSEGRSVKNLGLDKMTAELASRLNGLKKTKRTTTSRKRVVEKQNRGFFFSTKKKHAKREEWRNPNAEEKEKIVQELEDYIVID